MHLPKTRFSPAAVDFPAILLTGFDWQAICKSVLTRITKMESDSRVSSCNKLLAFELRALRACDLVVRETDDLIIAQTGSTHLSNIVSLRVQIRLMGGTPCSCQSAESDFSREILNLDHLIAIESECIRAHLAILETCGLPSELRDLIRYTLVPDLQYNLRELRKAKGQLSRRALATAAPALAC